MDEGRESVLNFNTPIVVTFRTKLLYLLYPIAFVVLGVQVALFSVPNLCQESFHFHKVNIKYEKYTGDKIIKTSTGRTYQIAGSITHYCEKGGGAIFESGLLRVLLVGLSLPIIVLMAISRIPIAIIENAFLDNIGQSGIVYFGYFWASCLAIIAIVYFCKIVIPNLKCVYGAKPVEPKPVYFFGWYINPIWLSVYFLLTQAFISIPHLLEHGFVLIF